MRGARTLEDVRERVLSALAAVGTVEGKYTVNAARYLRRAKRSAP